MLSCFVITLPVYIITLYSYCLITKLSYSFKLSIQILIGPYLDSVIVRLAGFCVRLVWHEPRLQQVLVKTISKSSHWSVICREGQNKRNEVKKAALRWRSDWANGKQWETDKWGSPGKLFIPLLCFKVLGRAQHMALKASLISSFVYTFLHLRTFQYPPTVSFKKVYTAFTVCPNLEDIIQWGQDISQQQDKKKICSSFILSLLLDLNILLHL